MNSGRQPSLSTRPLRLTDEDLAYGLDRGLFTDAYARALVRNHNHGETDADDELELIKRVEDAHRRELFGQVAPFRQPQLPHKELLLSQKENENTVGILIAWLCAGLLIVGNTGSGKTTLLEWIAIQLAPHLRGMWLTDMYKTRLRHLRPAVAGHGRDLIVLSSRSFKINVLQACGDVLRFIPFIADLLVRILGMPPLAGTILPGFLHRLYDRFGNLRGRNDFWPTLQDLYLEIFAATEINPQAKAAIIERLRAVLGEMPAEQSAFRRAWSPIELSDRWIVFEMLGTTERVKNLILSYLLFGLFLEAMSNPSQSSHLKHIVAFDDTQRLMNLAAGAGDLAPITELTAITRETGHALAVIVQSMEGLPRGLVANLATKIMGRLGINEDWTRLGNDMGLSGTELKWCKHHLRPGRFVGQVACGDWRYPFLMTVPSLALPRSVTEAEAIQSVALLDDLPTRPATEFANFNPYETAVAICTTTSCGAGVMDEGAARLLKVVIEHPGTPSSELPRLARMGARRVQKLRKYLVSENLVREQHVATSSTGRTAIVLEPQPAAFDALGFKPDQHNRPDGSGGAA